MGPEAAIRGALCSKILWQISRIADHPASRIEDLLPCTRAGRTAWVLFSERLRLMCQHQTKGGGELINVLRARKHCKGDPHAGAGCNAAAGHSEYPVLIQ